MERASRLRWYRMGAMAFAWLFGACVVLQIFLAGLSLFESAGHWQDHRNFGQTIGILLLPLLVLVVLGRLPRPVIGMTVVLLVLYLVQINLPSVSNGYIAAVHPLVGFILLGLPFQLGARIRSVIAGAAPAALSTASAGLPDETRAR